MKSAAITTLPVSAVEPSPTNPRKTFAPEKITQLADTIKAQGRILQKLLVRPWPGREGVYECVDGARRRLAALQLGLDTVPVDVLELTDAQVIEIQLITGETGEPLSPLEEAEGFQTALALKDPASGEPCFTLRSLADKLGCGHNHIQQRISLLKLPSDVRKMVSAGTLAPRTANLLTRVAGKTALAAAISEVVYPRHSDTPLGYREAEALIHEKFMVSLRKAPFDPSDATLDGPEGQPLACAVCPLKTGNDVERFGEGDKNTCTNPTCYRTKANLHWDRTKAKAASQKQRVLSDEEAAEVFEKNSPTVQIAFSSPYVDIHAKPTYRHVANEVEDKNLPTWAELIESAAEKKGIKVPVVLARDRDGKQWELVQLTLAIEAARALGENYFKKVPASESLSTKDRVDRDLVRSTVRATDDFEARKKAEAAANKLRNHTNIAGLNQIFTQLVGDLPSYTMLRTVEGLLETVAFDLAGRDGLELIAKTFGLKLTGGDFELDDAVGKWIDELSKSEKFAALVVLLVVQPMRFKGIEADGFKRVAQILNVDVSAIEQQVAADLAPKKKAKAEKPKKLSPEEIEATVRKLHGEGKALVEIYLATHISKRVIGKIIAKIEAASGGGKKKGAKK